MTEIIMVICSLLGVIGLIFIVYFGTRWLNKKFRSNGWNGLKHGIKIVDCIGIAQDKQLLIVKVGKKGMLIGAAPNSITKLSDIDDDDLSIMEQEISDNSAVSFSESLKKAFAGSNREVGGKDNEKD